VLGKINPFEFGTPVREGYLIVVDDDDDDGDDFVMVILR
jgi:hypothetical protein